MTPRTTAQPQMSVEEFEELARRAPELVRLEFVNGKVQVKPVPNGNHAEIVKWLQKLCMQHRPDLWLYPEQGIAIGTYRKGRARPDGVSHPTGTSPGRGSGRPPPAY